MDVAQVTRMKVDPETHGLLYVISFFQGFYVLCFANFLLQNGTAACIFPCIRVLTWDKAWCGQVQPIVFERMALTRAIHPRHLPMLVKPKPWLSYNEGGYIYNKSKPP